MKKNIFFYTTLIILLFAGCSKMKDRMFDDLQLSYDIMSFLSHQVNIRVVNANMTSTNFPNAQVRISGINANEVYDINGGKDIVCQDGIADLVVSPGKDFSAPLVFNVTATADGFLPLTKTITIYPKDSVSVHTLQLLEMNQLPIGIDIENISIDTKQLSSTSYNLSSNTFDGETSQSVKMNIPMGMVINDENNNPIADPVSIKMVNYNGATARIRSLLPSMIHCTSNHLVKNGNEDITVPFIPINMIDLKLESVGHKVNSYSKSIKTNIELDPNTYNVMTSTTIRTGDIVSVYYRKNEDENWSFVTDAMIDQNINGKYYVNLDILKPGQYVSMAKSGGGGGTTTTSCTNTLTLTFSRPNNVNTLHDIEIRDGSTNKVLFDYPEVPVCNGCTFALPNKLPSGKSVAVIVYEYDFSDYKGRPVKNATLLSSCPSAATIAVDPSAVSGNPILRFDLKTYCPSTTGTSKYYLHNGRCNYKLYYNGGRFFNMGIAKDGKLETDRLIFDIRYYFQSKVSIVPQGQKKAVTNNLTRDRWTWKDPDIFPGGSITSAAWGKFTLVTGTVKTYEFSRHDWIAPQNACALYNY